MKDKNIISPRSLSGTGFLSVLITILVVVPAISGYWIFTEIAQEKSGLAKMADQYKQAYKTVLSNDVRNIMDFIDYKRSTTRQRVKDIVKERVHHAYSLAAHIHSMDKDRHSEAYIKDKIIETLRPIRWSNGTGYFFILNHQWQTVLNSDMPSFENKDNRALKDIDGRYITRDMVAIAQKKDSGFYTYRWSKPDESGVHHEKITYVKNFTPLNWVICAGFYVDDMETNIKQEILARIARMTDARDRQHIFVLKQDGFCLFHTIEAYHRKNLLSYRSYTGRPIIRELIDASRKPGGGYIEYPWEKPGTGHFENKLSFAAFVKEWQWTIGKGIYLDEIQNTIESEKKRFKKELKNNIFIIIVFSVFVVLVAAALGLIVTNRLDRGTRAFTVFLKKAADADIKIDVRHLIFRELKLLGRLANQMVEDRIQKEQALRNAILETTNIQNLLKNITDSMPSSLIAIDQEMKVIHWNRKAGLTTKTGARRAEGRIITDIFNLTGRETRSIEKTLATGTPCQLSRIEKQSGTEYRYEEMIVYPLNTGSIKGAVIRIDDITDKVKIEEMMIQSEKMLSVGGLAAGMAHEINNPLSGILGNIDVLQNRLLNDLPANESTAGQLGIPFETVRQYAEQRGMPKLIGNIQKAGGRAAKIVSDMLSFSRMSSSNFTPCDIARLLDQTIDLAATSYDLKKNFDFKQIEISRDYAPSMPMVECESAKLQQVFLNILSNGAHAMAENTGSRPARFNLKLGHDTAHAVITIADNGPGIPEDIKKRIFEPFFTTKEVGIGTGLGLSVSYFIITDHHNGSLEVDSTPGKGTAFIIRIPLKAQKTPKMP